MERLLGREVDMAEVENHLVKNFADVFGIERVTETDSTPQQLNVVAV
jgi:hypothetical protein